MSGYQYPIYEFPLDIPALQENRRVDWNREEAQVFLDWFLGIVPKRLDIFRNFALSINCSLENDEKLINCLFDYVKNHENFVTMDKDKDFTLMGRALCTDLYLYLTDKLFKRYPKRLSIGMYRIDKDYAFHNLPALFIDNQQTDLIITQKSHVLGLFSLDEKEEEKPSEIWWYAIRKIERLLTN